MPAGCRAGGRDSKQGKQMQVLFEVHQKVAETWPARNGKPAGSRKYFLLTDRSLPPKNRLRDNVMMVVREDDDAATRLWHDDNCEGRSVTVAVHGISNGRVRPVLDGVLVEDVPASAGKGK